jgi:IclR family pca regulon transcriptional regulator
MSVETIERRQTLQGLERGLAVIQAFSAEAPSMTLSEVGRRVGITPATARRILLTLEEFDFVRSNGRRFELSPRVLRLGWSALASLGRWDIALPYMEDLATEVEETCSATTLTLPDITFVARVQSRRIMNMSLSVGSRLPAYATAMGRVLLAGLDDDAVTRYLDETDLIPLTEHTTVDPDQLLSIVRTVREQGWALVDEELEIGLRSLSVPLQAKNGDVLAALNLCAEPSRVEVDEMLERMLPAMQRTSVAIGVAWLSHPAG